MLGLEILRDNHLTTEGWFLNEQAMREMNLPEDAASFMLDRHEKTDSDSGYRPGFLLLWECDDRDEALSCSVS